MSYYILRQVELVGGFGGRRTAGQLPPLPGQMARRRVFAAVLAGITTTRVRRTLLDRGGHLSLSVYHLYLFFLLLCTLNFFSSVGKVCSWYTFVLFETYARFVAVRAGGGVLLAREPRYFCKSPHILAKREMQNCFLCIAGSMGVSKHAPARVTKKIG